MHYAKTGDAKTACGKNTGHYRVKWTQDAQLVTCVDCKVELLTHQTTINRKSATNQISLQQLLNDGVLVAMHVYGTGLFNTPHDWEELGLDSTKSAERYKKGRRILAKEADKSLYNWGIACRRLPAEYSISLDAVNRLMGSRNWRWMPKNNLALFEAAFASLVNQKDLLIADILSKLEDYQMDAASFYQTEARMAWGAFHTRYGFDAIMVLPSGLIFESDKEQEYVDWVVDSVLTSFPSEQTILTEVYAAYDVFYPFTDSSVEEDGVRLIQAQMDKQALQAETKVQDARVQAAIDRARMAILNAPNPVQQLLEKALSKMVQMMTDATTSIAKGKHINWRLALKLEKAHDLWLILGGRQLANSQDIEDLLADLKQHLQGMPDLGYTSALSTLDKLAVIEGQLDSELAAVRRELLSAQQMIRTVLDDSVIGVLQDILQQWGMPDYLQLRGLLKDLAPGLHREHTLLLQAYLERIPTDLRKMHAVIPARVLEAQLAARMQTAYATDVEAARWTVQAWNSCVWGP